MIGSHATPERYGEQLFNAARAGEADRLTSLAAAFDPYSQEVLSSLEIQPHWQCLDVGAGPGTVAIWLAEQLGPDGEAVALDLDTRHLEHQARPRLRVQQADLTDPGFDPGRFDLVHARFLLMHLRDRDQLLKRMTGWLKPGGVLVLSDSVDVGTPSSPHAAYRNTMAALWKVLADTIGSDIDQGRRYPKLLSDAQLSPVSLACHVPVMTADSPFNQFWRLTLGQAAPRLLASGLVDSATLKATLDYLESPGTHELSLAMCTAIGHRPA